MKVMLELCKTQSNRSPLTKCNYSVILAATVSNAEPLLDIDGLPVSIEKWGKVREIDRNLRSIEKLLSVVTLVR